MQEGLLAAGRDSIAEVVDFGRGQLECLVAEGEAIGRRWELGRKDSSQPWIRPRFGVIAALSAFSSCAVSI